MRQVLLAFCPQNYAIDVPTPVHQNKELGAERVLYTGSSIGDIRPNRTKGDTLAVSWQ